MIASMQAASLEVLEKAKLPAPQARAIVQAIEIELSGARDTLATKHEMLQLKQDVLQALHALETKLEMKLETLRAELRVELHTGLSGVTREMCAGLSGATRQMYAALLGQMAVLLGAACFFVTHVTH